MAKMTKKEWDIIEKELDIYKQYENEVKEYLLFLMGYHPNNELFKCMQEKDIKIKELRAKRGSKVLGDFFAKGTTEFSKKEIERQSYIYAKYIEITRNTLEWLNAANGYLNIIS